MKLKVISFNIRCKDDKDGHAISERAPRLADLTLPLDADLIGFTVRVVVGAKGLANGGVEIKLRSEDKSKTRIVAPEAAAECIKELING